MDNQQLEIIESYVNGQKEQAFAQFNDLCQWGKDQFIADLENINLLKFIFGKFI